MLELLYSTINKPHKLLLIDKESFLLVTTYKQQYFITLYLFRFN